MLGITSTSTIMLGNWYTFVLTSKSASAVLLVTYASYASSLVAFSPVTNQTHVIHVGL